PLPSGPGRRLATLPMLASGSPGSWAFLSTPFRPRKRVRRFWECISGTCPFCRVRPSEDLLPHARRIAQLRFLRVLSGISSVEKREYFASNSAASNLGGTVKRNVFALGIAAMTCAAAVVIAQETPAKKTAPSKASSANSAAVAKGKDVFDKKCGVCHYANSDQKKIGPGLKGIGKRGTFTVNNNKVTDETLKAWIENGDSLMPPFKDVLDAQQIKDVIAYVKTL